MCGKVVPCDHSIVQDCQAAECVVDSYSSRPVNAAFWQRSHQSGAHSYRDVIHLRAGEPPLQVIAYGVATTGDASCRFMQSLPALLPMRLAHPFIRGNSRRLALLTGNAFTTFFVTIFFMRRIFHHFGTPPGALHSLTTELCHCHCMYTSVKRPMLGSPEV